MTPKEKAEELFNEMSNYTDGYAKQCALKVVDEILKNELQYDNEKFNTNLDYWQEVRNEIENI